mgnify:CR=1 FL=1
MEQDEKKIRIKNKSIKTTMVQNAIVVFITQAGKGREIALSVNIIS